jgi:ABC-type uncharacterized transport system YnjBCD ATPase subunit
MRLALEAVNVRVGAEQHLAEINLRLEPGSLNMLLGPTQAGKTSIRAPCKRSGLDYLTCRAACRRSKSPNSAGAIGLLK